MKTTRRGLVGVLAGAVAALPGKAETSTLVREIDCRIPGFSPPVKVLLDGKDVSHDCYRVEQFSDGSGRAYLLKRGANGEILWGGHDIVREVRSGRVQIIEPRRGV